MTKSILLTAHDVKEWQQHAGKKEEELEEQQQKKTPANHTNRPTNQPTNQPTNRTDHILPIPGTPQVEESATNKLP